jgi:hypothetical protein
LWLTIRQFVFCLYGWVITNVELDAMCYLMLFDRHRQLQQPSLATDYNRSLVAGTLSLTKAFCNTLGFTLNQT